MLNNSFNKYFINNTIILDSILFLSLFLQALLEKNTFKTKHFQKEIQSYNNALIFTIYYFNADE